MFGDDAVVHNQTSTASIAGAVATRRRIISGLMVRSVDSKMPSILKLQHASSVALQILSVHSTKISGAGHVGSAGWRLSQTEPKRSDFQNAVEAGAMKVRIGEWNVWKRHPI